MSTRFKRPPGRPRVGPQIRICLPEDLLQQIDQARGAADRSTFLRCAIQIGIGNAAAYTEAQMRAATLLEAISDAATDPAWDSLVAGDVRRGEG